MLEGEGAPSNLSEKAVQRPVVWRKEPFRQFLETPDCCTAGARRVGPWSTPTGSNPPSYLGAKVRKELTKKKRISISKGRTKCAVKKGKVSREERREIRRKNEKKKRRKQEKR